MLFQLLLEKYILYNYIKYYLRDPGKQNIEHVILGWRLRSSTTPNTKSHDIIGGSKQAVAVNFLAVTCYTFPGSNSFTQLKTYNVTSCLFVFNVLAPHFWGFHAAKNEVPPSPFIYFKFQIYQKLALN